MTSSAASSATSLTSSVLNSTFGSSSFGSSSIASSPSTGFSPHSSNGFSYSPSSHSSPSVNCFSILSGRTALPSVGSSSVYSKWVVLSAGFPV